MGNPMLLAAEGGGNAPILPHDLNEVIWGSIAIILVVSLIVWKGGPAIKAMWNGRIERLAGELDAAAAAKVTGEAELAAVEQRIADAAGERERIRSEATESAAAVREQLAARAVEDAAAVRRRGAADLTSSQQQVSVDLESELADLAVGAAEAVVTSNLDAATQAELVERYIASLAAGDLADTGGQR
jgi:F-type H+-transporting ATPase subunit b